MVLRGSGIGAGSTPDGARRAEGPGRCDAASRRRHERAGPAGRPRVPRGSGRSGGAPRRARRAPCSCGSSCSCLPRLWYDEATTGLLGLAVLQGELPDLLLRPVVHGRAGWLSRRRPSTGLLGVSARTLELVPVLLALAGVGLTVRLAHDAFGPRAGALHGGPAGGPAGLPPLLVPRGPQPLPAHDRPRDPRPAPRAAGARRPVRPGHAALRRSWAAPSGWPSGPTSSRSSTIPAVAVLLLRRGLRPLVPRLLAALPAFALGSLPHWLYGVPHGTALPAAGSTGGARGRADPPRLLRRDGMAHRRRCAGGAA